MAFDAWQDVYFLKPMTTIGQDLKFVAPLVLIWLRVLETTESRLQFPLE